jgi:hypothetical protein
MPACPTHEHNGIIKMSREKKDKKKKDTGTEI